MRVDVMPTRHAVTDRYTSTWSHHLVNIDNATGNDGHLTNFLAE